MADFTSPEATATRAALLGFPSVESLIPNAPVTYLDPREFLGAADYVDDDLVRVYRGEGPWQDTELGQRLRARQNPTLRHWTLDRPTAVRYSGGLNQTGAILSGSPLGPFYEGVLPISEAARGYETDPLKIDQRQIRVPAESSDLIKAGRGSEATVKEVAKSVAALEDPKVSPLLKAGRGFLKTLGRVTPGLNVAGGALAAYEHEQKDQNVRKWLAAASTAPYGLGIPPFIGEQAGNLGEWMMSPLADVPDYVDPKEIPAYIGNPETWASEMEPSGAATAEALSQLDLSRAAYEEKAAAYDLPQMQPFRSDAPEARFAVAQGLQYEPARVQALQALDLRDQDEEEYNKRQHLDLVYGTGIQDTTYPGAERSGQEWVASKIPGFAMPLALGLEDNLRKVNRALEGKGQIPFTTIPEYDPDKGVQTNDQIDVVADTIRDLVLNKVYADAKVRELSVDQAFVLPNAPDDKREFYDEAIRFLESGDKFTKEDLDRLAFPPGTPRADIRMPELDESRMLASVGDDPASAFRFDAATPVSQALQGIFPGGAPTSLDPAVDAELAFQYNPIELGLDPSQFTRERVGASSNFLANLMAEGTEAQKTAIQRAISPRTAPYLRENLAAHFARDDADSPFITDPSTGEPIQLAQVLRAPQARELSPTPSKTEWFGRRSDDVRFPYPETGFQGIPEFYTEPVEPATFISDPDFTPSLGGYTIAPSGPVVGETEQPIAQAVAQALANTDQPVQQNLQALAALAQTDPTIAERYTTPGSQELEEITSQVDSFATAPKKKEKKTSAQKALDNINKKAADEAKKATEAWHNMQMQMHADTMRRLEEERRAKRYAGGTGGALMYT